MIIFTTFFFIQHIFYNGFVYAYSSNELFLLILEEKVELDLGDIVFFFCFFFSPSEEM